MLFISKKLLKNIVAFSYKIGSKSFLFRAIWKILIQITFNFIVVRILQGAKVNKKCEYQEKYYLN